MRLCLPPILVLLLAWALPAGAEPMRFAAFGDMPYRAEDEPRVLTLTAEVNRRAPAFTVFLGDTKSSREPCTEEMLVTRPQRVFARFDRAVIYTPGDNEWTDCAPRGPGESGPADALGRLREAFFGGPTSLGGRPIRLERQGGRGGPFGKETENARWTHARILFATLNLPGVPRPELPGARQVQPEALLILPRLAAAAAVWIDETFAEARRKQARAVVLAFQADLWHPCHMVAAPDCRARPVASGGEAGTRALRDLPYDVGMVLGRIADGARAFRRPVLLLHGDGHTYLVQSWPSDGHGGTIPHATRMMVPGNREVAALLIRADPEARIPFVAELVRAAE
ncbi:hypothetical protein [Neoroseomonas soli]|uniref:Calcineurin-like phosphoesterase domain-containing protein n=1 Tax=Neoroseomonas soli TaxID=1081025 RepID=A0A9X9WS65_9PROT|nr:hypothetical protein [Neoroseomonas soli]MBR0669994.1 hypothetical protein [Neoroseomonas soli]